MRKSARVTAVDELLIVRMVHECVELGDDADAWQKRLIEGLLRLTGGMMAAVGPTPPHRPGNQELVQNWAASQMGGGWPSEDIRVKFTKQVADPEFIAAHPVCSRFFADPQPDLTWVRLEVLDNREWDKSTFRHEVLWGYEMDEGLVSRTAVDVVNGGYLLTVVRAKGEKPFPLRAGKLVELVQRELQPHLGRSLLLTTQPNRHGLSPRILALLDCLLDGDSEKEAALRLGLRASTVHDYTKILYRHFGVNSRAELLAYFLRRYRRRPS